MKNVALLFLFFYSAIALAQPKMEMTPKGFPAVEIPTPNKPNEKLIEAAKSWAATFNKNGYDVYDVIQNSLKIDGLRKNAYFYRSLGETYTYNIKYTLEVVFKTDRSYILTFSMKEAYAKEVLVKTTIADFYTPDGKLKEDFVDVKPSLESTADKIVKSFSEFIAN